MQYKHNFQIFASPDVYAVLTAFVCTLFYKVERSLEAERPDSFVSETSSVRDSVGSFKEWEDYTTTLHEVLNWLSQAERTLESQERISDNVDAVKKQFHGHEVGQGYSAPLL